VTGKRLGHLILRVRVDDCQYKSPPAYKQSNSFTMLDVDFPFLTGHNGSMKITGAQVRASRAFLRWTIADLARAADVGLSTIQKVEEVDGDPRVVSTLQWRSDARDEALAKIRGALEKNGITFLPGTDQGAGLRGRLKG
jgi:hypothetical protein